MSGDAKSSALSGSSEKGENLDTVAGRLLEHAPSLYAHALREMLKSERSTLEKLMTAEDKAAAAAESAAESKLVMPHDEAPATPTARVHAAVVARLQKTADALFADCSNEKAKKLQEAEVKEMGLADDDVLPLTYAGVDFELFSHVFCKQLLFDKPGGVFVDLGAGTGRALFTAALLHEFDSLIGVEYLKKVFDESTAVLERWKKETVPALEKEHKERRKQDVKLLHDDLRNVDWSAADVVYASAVLFPDDLMRDLQKQAERMKEGAYLIVLIRHIESPHFERIESPEPFPFSFTMNVYRKVKPKS